MATPKGIVVQNRRQEFPVPNKPDLTTAEIIPEGASESRAPDLCQARGHPNAPEERSSTTREGSAASPPATPDPTRRDNWRRLG